MHKFVLADRNEKIINICNYLKDYTETILKVTGENTTYR